jgi:hypothetical protein
VIATALLEWLWHRELDEWMHIFACYYYCFPLIHRYTLAACVSTIQLPPTVRSVWQGTTMPLIVQAPGKRPMSVKVHNIIEWMKPVCCCDISEI